MIQTIRVVSREENYDLLGKQIGSAAKKNGISKIRTARVYRIEGVDRARAKILAEKLFCEKILQDYKINSPILKGKYQTVEVSYKPGVMNTEAASIIKASHDLGIKIVAADSSTEYDFFGKVSKEKSVEIIDKLKLYNKLIEHVVEKSPKTLLITGKVGKVEIIPIRKMNDEELMILSKDKLFLNLEEMKVIQNYFIKIG